MIRAASSTRFGWVAALCAGAVACGSADDDGTTGGGSSLKLVVSTAQLALTEGGAPGTFQVSLGVQPKGQIDVTVTVSDPDAVTVSPTTLSFSGPEALEPQTITVTPSPDGDTTDEALEIVLSATQLADVKVSVTVADDDQQVVLVSPGALELNEGRGSSVGVVLGSQPEGNYTVEVTISDDTALRANPMLVRFTRDNWDQTQQVSVSAISDDDSDDETVQLGFTGPGADPVSVSVRITDIDDLDLLVDPPSLTLTEGGPSASFTVQLTSAPTSPVVVNFVSSDILAVSVFPQTRRFDADTFNIPESISVSAVSDDDLLDERVWIRVMAGGLMTRDVSVSITDDDRQQIRVNPASLSIDENGTGTFTVRLAFDPQANLTANVVPASTSVITVSPTTLAMNPATWNQEQQVTVRGVSDFDMRDDSSAVSIEFAGATPARVSVDVRDTSVLTATPMPGSLNIPEGRTGTVAVTLSAAPLSATTVSISSMSSEFAVTPSTLTFDSANAGVAQSVFIEALQDTNRLDETSTIRIDSASFTAAAATVRVTSVDDD